MNVSRPVDLRRIQTPATFTLHANWTRYAPGEPYPEEGKAGYSRDYEVYRLSVTEYLILVWSVGERGWYWEINESPGPLHLSYDDSSGTANSLEEAQNAAVEAVNKHMWDNWVHWAREEYPDTT